MGVSRINVFALLQDQYRFMVHVGSRKPSRFPRFLVWIVAPIGFIVSIIFQWQMNSVEELVGALGLMAGVFLSAFAVIFSLRVNIASKPVRVLDQNKAQLMDEGALTVLTAGLISGVDAAWLAVVSASTPNGDSVAVCATAVAVGLSSLVALYFALSIRRLHKLYTDTFPPFWKT